MRKLFFTIMLALSAWGIAACSEGGLPLTDDAEVPGGGEQGDTDTDGGTTDGDSDADSDEAPDTENPAGGKILVAYFSRWGNTNYAADVDATTGASILESQGTRYGGTEFVANYISSAVGGTVHLIETSAPYPTEFSDVRDQNHAEQAAGTLPELKSRVENMEQYETVFIGYPVWATDVPQAILSFLHAYDFTGKTIVPFCTHDGYGAGSSYRSIRNAATGATVLEGLALRSTEILSAENRVRQWIEQLGIASESAESGAVSIAAGDQTFAAEWYDTPTAREVRAMFPLKVRLGRYGGREYYGALPSRPETTEEGQLTFENGDITYCPSNNTIAIFYGKADDPSLGQLTMRVIPIGKLVGADLSVFDTMSSREEFTFDNNN